MKKYYQKFIDYIKNTGGSPTIEWFDDDWEPIGPRVRRDLVDGKVAYEKGGKIHLYKK